MSWLLASAIVVALGVIATLTAALWYFARRALSRSDDRGELGVLLAKAETRAESMGGTIEELEAVVKESFKHTSREIAARKTVERQRDKALQLLAEHGDPDGIAAVINMDLDRLRDLSEEEELPAVPAAAGNDDRDGAGAVHGAAGSGDRGDGG